MPNTGLTRLYQVHGSSDDQEPHFFHRLMGTHESGDDDWRPHRSSSLLLALILVRQILGIFAILRVLSLIVVFFVRSVWDIS